jgi:hypothetical protein
MLYIRSWCGIKTKKVIYIMIISSMLFQTGFQNKGTFNITIVPAYFDQATMTLKYDIKISNPPRRSLSKDINLAVNPGKDLMNLLEVDPDQRYGLNLVGGSVDIVDNIGRFHLEYKVKENVNAKEITFFALNSTLVILKGEKIVEKINLRKYKDSYFPLQHPISNLVGVLDEKTN